MLRYRPRSIALVSVLLGALTGCGDDLVGPGEPPEGPPDVPTGDAIAGRVAFVEECGTCHSALDGFDVAFFGFPDTTIVRRAVHHVDTATALDIVAHIRSFDIRQATRTTRVFQPQQALLGSDLDFALGLFGQDG